MTGENLNHDDNGKAHVKVGLVGPRGVGKTSLVAALIDSGKEMLSGLPVTLEANKRSEQRIDRFNNKLRSSLLVEDFVAPQLQPTETLDSLEFDLTVDRDDTIGVGFDILDFPGGWLDAGEKPPLFEDFLRHVRQSPILLVPIDATYLIESRGAVANGRAVKGDLHEALQIAQVGRIVRQWAIDRNVVNTDVKAKEPAVLVLVPVKCETYFADNGGQQDKSATLYDDTIRYYGEMIRAARAETPNTRLDVYYCPVDTIGAVELKSGTWSFSDSGIPQFKATFKKRPGQELRRRGAGDRASVQKQLSGWAVADERELLPLLWRKLRGGGLTVAEIKGEDGLR